MEHFGEGNDTSATLTVVVKMWGNGDTHALREGCANWYRRGST